MKHIIFANRLDDLQHAISKYAKKAQRAGLEAPTLTIIDQYAKRVKVYEADPITQTQHKRGEMVIDVVEIDIYFPPYKLGDYTPAAVIDHTTATGGAGNMIYKLDPAEIIPQEYRTAPAFCEHCKTRRNRAKTVLLRNAHGELKQVGTDCLSEYTGVTEFDILRNMEAVNSILLEADTETGNYSGGSSNHVDTMLYLEKCIHLTTAAGYNKNIKNKAHDVKPEEITAADKDNAQKVIDFFRGNEFDDEFLYNIKTQLQHDYTRPYNGFIAYAYTAYIKENERQQRRQEAAESRAKSDYYGTAGERIKNIQVIGRIVAGYETIYGYTYIYEFRDIDNHVFIWKTSSNFKTDDNGNYSGRITATIKEHNEYNGTKQTILTRVKAV